MEQSQSTQDHATSQIPTQFKLESDQENDKDSIGSSSEDEEEDFVPEAEDDEIEVDSHSDSESDEPVPKKRQKTTQLQASNNSISRSRGVSGTITSEVLANIEESLGYDPRRKSDRKRAAPQRIETLETPIIPGKKRKVHHEDSDDSNDKSSDFEEYTGRAEVEDEQEDFEVPYDETSSSEQEESDSNSDFGETSHKANAGTKIGSNRSRNLRKRSSAKSYCEDSDDEDSDDNDEALESDDSQSNQLEGVVDVETSTEPMIEKILDHRLRTANNNEESKQEMEYLVNWKAKAHIHNTWMVADELMKFKGNKKLTNYIKNYQADLQWRQGASDDQQESADIAIENFRDTYSQWLKVDRVIAVRDVDNEEQPTSEINYENNNNGTNLEQKSRTQQYLVKWTGLPYSEATWEFHKDIAEYQNHIDAFLARNETVYIPCGIVPPHKRPPFQKLESQPSSRWFTGELRDYQMEGLNWLIFNWTRDINGILADEMGLGKTVQTITLLGYLQFELNVCGPFLVVVPLSTMSNWETEFKKWCPDINVVVYTGDAKARNTLVQYEFYFPQPGKTGQKRVKFNVLLTTYELILKDKNILGEMKWTYLVVDEGHRLKNNESMLHEVLMEFNTGNRLLLTGTPLQNSIKELWSLLFFLNSEKFNNLAEFQNKYSDLKEQETILKLHEELKPYLLRRVKKDVEKSLPAKIERILRVEMTPLQKKYYKWILTRNYTSLNKGLKGNQASLLNIVMELKKASNHPYLFDNAEDLNSSSPLEALIKNSGKLILLDKLLIRLKETGHRVLIFSQMVRMLDILSDYLSGRGFQFQRLDGSMSSDQRQKAMHHFNAPDSPDFCFILSTRAGGLGINLTTADTVIIFDSDWNPQNDLQAEARAHRIGQKKVVSIYRLVTKRTVEEDILQRAKNKMVLDHLVIQTMGDSSMKPVTGNNVFNKQELAAILQFGAKDLFQEDENASSTQKIEELDIDVILARAETSDVQGTTAGEELLNAFKVADFNVNNEEPTYDPQLWSKIVPKSAIEETQTQHQAPLYLPPRQRKRVHESEPFIPKQLTNTKKQKTLKSDKKKKITKLETNQRKSDGLLSAREIKNFIQSFNRFGQLKRLSEVVQDAKLDHPLKEIEKIATEIVSLCTEATKNAGHKKVYVEHGGVKINASELVQRMEDMSQLEKKISGNTPENFRLSLSVKSIKDWACSRDDAMLLYGVHRHGFGNWEAIQRDKSLGLSKKISTNLNDMLPKPAELKKRVDVLLAALVLDRKEGKHQSNSDRKKDSHSHSRHSKETQSGKHHHSHKSNSEHTKSQAKASDSKGGSSSKSLSTQIRDYLEPVKDKLHKFRDMQNDNEMPKEERLQKTKLYLLAIGDQIQSTIEKRSTTTAKELRENLWRHVSNYASSQMTGEKMQKLYEAIKKK